MDGKSYPGSGPSAMSDMPMGDEPPPHAAFDAMEADMPMMPMDAENK